MIVRGWRRRRVERELVRADLVVRRRAGGGGAGRGPAGIVPIIASAAWARTRPRPRARCTSFAAGPNRRT